MRISVLTAADPLVRSIAILSLSDVSPVLSVDLNDDGTILTYSTGFEESVTEVPLAHSCIACSLREAIIPFLLEMRPDDVILALPPAVESATIVPLFSDDVAELGWTVTSVAHVCELSRITDELLSHVSLAERGMELFEDDERCVGEIQLMNIGYSDLTITAGNGETGCGATAMDLVEHFRPLDSLLIPSLSEVTAEILFGGQHNVDSAIRRIHPATTAAWGGPSSHGVWTLDLSSDRAFHPERFIDALSELCEGDVCVRGCFWLPTRPDTICALNAHGGLITFGSAGDWNDAPRTHLIVTGTRDPHSGYDRRPLIEEAFSRCLLTHGETHSLSWAGVSDGLGDWFE